MKFAKMDLVYLVSLSGKDHNKTICDAFLQIYGFVPVSEGRQADISRLATQPSEERVT